MATADRRRRGRSPPSSASSSQGPGASAASPYFLPDLIPEVAKRLTNLQDFFALRAACRAYRALLPLTASNLASQAPLLLVLGDAAQPQSRTLFHLHLRRIHRFRLPSSTVADADADADQIQTVLHPLGCRLAIYTSYHRRLFASHLEYYRVRRRDLSIIHLLTGERIRLPCPPFNVSRVLLFGDLVVAWACEWDGIGIPGQVGYCRIGHLDPNWHLVSISSLPNQLEDMIFVKGTLYALVNPGHRLAVVELPDQKKDFKLVFLGRSFAAPEHKPWLFCLAECRGELLLVFQRHKGFLVLQWQSGEAKWEEITSLGGCTLFLMGTCLFAGCLGPGHPGIRGDCIYIMNFRGCSVWSLIDQSSDFVVENPRRAVPHSWCWPPLWVFPSMW